MSAVADPAPPPFVVHDPKHIHPEEDHPRRAALTSVPDLRFEYGFLKSVRPYFRLRRDYKGKEKETATPRDVLEIEWKDIAWVTARDQVLSPLVQGALWAIAGYWLTPFFGRARSVLPSPPEGGIAKWLRGLVQSYGLGATPTHKL